MKKPQGLAILVLTVSCLQAQPARPGTDMQERWRRDDRNADGRVDRQEFSGPDRLFDRLDQNRDGAIDAAEIARPAPGAADQPTLQVPDGIELTRDVVYGRAGSKDLTLDLVRPRGPADPPRPLVVFVHGGAWRSGDSRGGIRQLIPLVQKGFIGASINYRLSQEAIFPAQIADVRSALRFLRARAREYGIDPAHVGAWGSSAGGHLVALLGTAAEEAALNADGGSPGESIAVQAVCDWFGPSDLLTIADHPSQMDHAAADSPESLLIGGTLRNCPEKARAASPIAYVSGNEPPFLIMHGTKDMTVPFQQSVVLVEALRKAGCDVTFVPLEGAGHGGPEFAKPASRDQVIAFFVRVLGQPAPLPAGASGDQEPQ